MVQGGADQHRQSTRRRRDPRIGLALDGPMAFADRAGWRHRLRCGPGQRSQRPPSACATASRRGSVFEIDAAGRGTRLSSWLPRRDPSVVPSYSGAAAVPLAAPADAILRWTHHVPSLLKLLARRPTCSPITSDARGPGLRTGACDPTRASAPRAVWLALADLLAAAGAATAGSALLRAAADSSMDRC